MPTSTTPCGWSTRSASPRPISFKYSRRPGTPGAAMADQVPEAVKIARLAALQALLGQQARAFNGSKVGTTVPVLFAEPGRKPGQIIGKTPWLQSVYAEGDPRLIGRIVEVRLDRRPRQQPGRRDRHSRLRGRGVSDPRRSRPLGRRAPHDVRRQRAAGRALRRSRPPSRAHRAARQRAAERARQPARHRRRARRCRRRAQGPRRPLRAAEARPVDRDGRRRCRRALRPHRRRAAATSDGIRTRRRTVQARSPGQRDYLDGAARARHGVRAGAGRHRQDLSRRRHGRVAAAGRQGRAHRAVAAGGRGRRAAGLPARRHEGEDRSLSAAALRRAARHAAGRADRQPHGIGRDRDRAARLHARPHAGALLRHPRRGAEHHADADADVPDAPGRGLAHGGHRRSQPDRPAGRPAVGPERRGRHAEGRRGRALRAADLQGRRAPRPGDPHRRGL